MELLKELARAFGPAGSEGQVRDLIEKHAAPYADEIKTDPLGNLIVHKKGNGRKLMLFSGMDEPGVVAVSKDDKNFYQPAALGSVKQDTLHGTRVRFANGALGIICKKTDKTSKIEDYFLDCLDGCKAENLNTFSLGDSAVFCASPEENHNFLSAKAMKSRSGCYILLEVLKQLGHHSNDLYFVFAVQGELGGRGVKTASAYVKPEWAIGVEGVSCDDHPGGQNSLELGKGPAVKVRDSGVICHPAVKNFLISAAEKKGLPFQLSLTEEGGAMTGAVHTTGVGVATGSLCIPVRYISTPCETVCKADVTHAVSLLHAVCEEGL